MTKDASYDALKDESTSLKVAWVGVVQAAIWPLVALIALLRFANPISGAIETAANGGGATVEIAGLKITLPKSELLPPPAQIKHILPQLTPATIQNIVSNYGGKNRVDTCYTSTDDDELKDGSTKDRLKKFCLIRFEREDPSIVGKDCKDASITTYTPEYDLTRDYLINVLKNIKFHN